MLISTVEQATQTADPCSCRCCSQCTAECQLEWNPYSRPGLLMDWDVRTARSDHREVVVLMVSHVLRLWHACLRGQLIGCPALDLDCMWDWGFKGHGTNTPAKDISMPPTGGMFPRPPTAAIKFSKGHKIAISTWGGFGLSLVAALEMGHRHLR